MRRKGKEEGRRGRSIKRGKREIKGIRNERKWRINITEKGEEKEIAKRIKNRRERTR